MTASEKEKIYQLLKNAASCYGGYTPKSFKEQTPVFMDDKTSSSKTSEIPLSSSSVSQTENLSSAEPEKTENQPQSPSQNVQSFAAETEKTQEKSETKSGMTLEKLMQKIENCHNCVLCNSRKQPLLGCGSETPLVLVVTDGPFALEDQVNMPFIKESGDLLDKMLDAIHLSRNKNAYLTHIVKCCPPNNRLPMKDETQACSGYLQALIHLLKPKMILAMGRVSAQTLTDKPMMLNALRQKFFDYNGTPVLITHSPETLLQNGELKKEAWADLKLFRTRLNEIVPDYFKN